MTGLTAARALVGFCLLAAPAAAMPAAAAAQLPGSSTVLGGFRAIGTDGENVQAGAAFAAESMGGTLASVDSAEQQGGLPSTVLRLELTLQDGSRWRVVVIRPSGGGSFSMRGEPGQLQEATSEDGPDTGSNQAPDSDDDE